MVLLVLLAVPGAVADIRPVDASLTGVRSEVDQVIATLTVRGAPGPIEPTSLSASLGGEATELTASEASTIPRSTMLAIDTSGSMGTEGMRIVRQAVREFLAEAPPDVKVGVVSFSTTAGVDLAPTTDREAVLEWVDGLTADGYTALYQGVLTSVEALGTEGERSIILLSDGGDTMAERRGGPAVDTAERAEAISAVSEAGVRVEAIAFRESDEARDDVLAAFAEAGGGSVADAGDGAAVSAAFQAAALALSSQLVLTIDRPAGVSGVLPLEVTGTAGGAPFTATTSVDVGAVAPPTDGSNTAAPVPSGPEAPNRVQRSLLGVGALILAAVGVFVGVFVLVLALLSPALRSRKAQRLEAIEQFRVGPRASGASARVVSPTTVTEQIVGVSDRFMASRRSTNRTLALIERADLPIRAGEWLLLRIVAVVLGASLGYLILAGRSALVGAIVGAAVGVISPSVILRSLAAQRARRFEEVLPDVMMLVATSLSSGFSLLQGLDAVARDAPAPANKEFSRALAQARIGADVSDALDIVAVRMGSENLRWTTMAIRIQREVGGNLAGTLRTTAATLREREYLKRQVRSLSAEGRVSAYVLVVLPIGLMAYMTIVNYEYVSLLWTSLLGIVMLVGAMILLVVGIFWMRKVVRIEV